MRRSPLLAHPHVGPALFQPIFLHRLNEENNDRSGAIQPCRRFSNNPTFSHSEPKKMLLVLYAAKWTFPPDRHHSSHDAKRQQTTHRRHSPWRHRSVVKIGVFIPIGSRGWLRSTTSPKTFPTFDLNRTIVQRAEHYGLDFALSMIKMRGFDGPSEFWVHNLESFTLMAGLAAVTKRIDLYASIALLTLPPALAARMAMTVDSIAPGRFGVNIVTGWQPKEYQQMGLWPGDAHFARRYDYATEYVTVMKDLWSTGVSNFNGDYFQMDDCRLSPQPSKPIKIIAAGQSDRGMQFVAEHADFNFIGATGLNDVSAVAQQVERLNKFVSVTGRDVGAFSTAMIIAGETDEAAFAKWEHYKSGTDLVALNWQKTQAALDTKASAHSTATRLQEAANVPLPHNGNRIIGSYSRVAALLDEMATTPGLKGIMLTFDDFIVGMEQFGEHIQPLMTTRNHIQAAA
jgi:pyrimidine oxygenase